MTLHLPVSLPVAFVVFFLTLDTGILLLLVLADRRRRKIGPVPPELVSRERNEPPR